MSRDSLLQLGCILLAFFSLIGLIVLLAMKNHDDEESGADE